MRIGEPTFPLSEEEKAEENILIRRPNQGNVQYRFASKEGFRRYKIFKITSLATGMDRGFIDWGSATATDLGLEGARLKRYDDGDVYLEAIGVSTPIKAPNHMQIEDKITRQIIKELRAEKD